MGKYGPEKTPYLDIFHAVNATINKTKYSRMDYVNVFSPLLNTLSQISQAYKKKEKEKQKQNHKL